MNVRKFCFGGKCRLAVLAVVIGALGVLCACQSSPVSSSYYDQYDCVRNCDGNGGADTHGGGGF
jgi:hypothetical protein